ncbi:helix-turn-helix domain-containing protein [Rhizobium sp. 814_E9_N1_1]|uniref:helix-turn-helix domain-containing protein n=1 Tax=unclassified Rhizobium TaxID=2613769 RepID=UPI003F1FF020
MNRIARSRANQHIFMKWGAPALVGYAMVPNLLLRINRYVKPEHRLTASEMVVLLLIVSYWRAAKPQPFPSIEKLAVDSCISTRQIKRIVKSLEAKGYMKVEKAAVAGYIFRNVYNLTQTRRRLEGIYLKTVKPSSAEIAKFEAEDVIDGFYINDELPY